MRTGIRHFDVAQTPIAVIDFETTGLQAGPDRVVEVSVVRIDPGERPRLVLDTLVNPERPVAATEIHGITDRAVRHAPTFRDVLGPMNAAISGCVVAAYNAYFDMRFLRSEAQRAGTSGELPFICLMYLRPMLGLGTRCRLELACQSHGIVLRDSHRTSADSMAAAQLVPFCLDGMQRAGIRTFGELASRGSYAFFESFDRPPALSPTVQRQCRMLTREEAERGSLTAAAVCGGASKPKAGVSQPILVSPTIHVQRELPHVVTKRPAAPGGVGGWLRRLLLGG
jgi:DNA polymerase-3 subunit epsilon